MLEKFTFENELINQYLMKKYNLRVHLITDNSKDRSGRKHSVDYFEHVSQVTGKRKYITLLNE